MRSRTSGRWMGMSLRPGRPAVDGIRRPFDGLLPAIEIAGGVVSGTGSQAALFDGWVVKLQNQATDALRSAYEELVSQLPQQSILAMDETPTKAAAAKSWLWTYVATAFTVLIASSSSKTNCGAWSENVTS